MNFFLSSLALLSLPVACSAFAPAAFISAAQRSAAAQHDQPLTVRYISSWGTSGPPHRWADAGVKEDPAKNVQAYLKEPEAVEARENIDGTVLVSGLVRSKDRTDQFIFDLLNHEESAFEFTKIVAFVDDTAFAKKRLLSRSARYTGLLDKLDFIQATSAGALPEVGQLEGVKSWVAYFDGTEDGLSKIKEAAAIAKQASSLENFAVLLGNANELDASACTDALESMKSGAATNDKFSYTLVAVGKCEDRPEGKECYQYREFGTEDAVLPAKATFSRDESYRMVTELLQLECGKNKALTFAEVYNVNITEYKLVKGLREAGYARPQEIDHMVRIGPEAYKQAIEDFKKENPDAARGYTTTDAWWEREEFQRSRRRSAEREEEKLQVIKDERTKEIEQVAKEWAKREYFRQSMAGAVGQDMTEEKYIESVWERAKFEGELKYRQMKGEVVDEEAELADFKKRQERKQEMMLKRAKQELTDLLEGENLGGEDLKKAMAGSSDDDDDDE